MVINLCAIPSCNRITRTACACHPRRPLGRCSRSRCAQPPPLVPPCLSASHQHAAELRGRSVLLGSEQPSHHSPHTLRGHLSRRQRSRPGNCQSRCAASSCRPSISPAGPQPHTNQDKSPDPRRAFEVPETASLDTKHEINKQRAETMTQKLQALEAPRYVRVAMDVRKMSWSCDAWSATGFAGLGFTPRPTYMHTVSLARLPCYM
jgi:hypothetical protein